MPTQRKPIDVDALVDRYNAGASVKQLAEQFDVSRPTVTRHLLRRGITPRGRSEAELLKWSQLTDPARRRRQVAAAQKARRGQTDSIEVKMKRAATCQARLSHAWPTEHAFAAALTAVGAVVSQQTAVGPYNLDITFDGSPVAVEVEIGNAFRCGRTQNTLKRLRFLIEQGWRVLIVYTKNRKLAFPRIVRRALEWQEVVARDATGEIGLVDGAGEPTTIPGCDFAGSSRAPGF